MLNQIIIVGRLAKEIEIEELENGGHVAYITVVVPRSYKNIDGTYETDIVPVTIYDTIAKNIKEYCHKGDVLGIKGRVQMTGDNLDEQVRIVAEKVTFLSSKSEEE